MQSVAGNQRAMNKLKFQIPVELLKINLIWIYEDFKKSKLKYSQDLVLKHLHEWNEIVDVKDLNGTFLMTGFYLYSLIDNYGDENQEINDEE